MTPVGATLRDEGVEQLTFASTFDPWPRMADKAIEHLAELGHPFVADDVRDLAGDPSRPGQMGAALLAAVRAGVIEEAGFQRSDRPQRRRGLIVVGKGASP